MKALLVVLAGAMSLQAATYYVTIAGLGGEPDYEQRFSGWAKDLDKALRGSAEAQIVTLYGPAATKARFQSVMGQVARDAKPDDALVVTLIGHGSFDGTDYKINLPGPDLTAAELAELVDRVAAKRQLVVNMTSCSGASRPALERANRVVVTATRSAAERNATIFARYWVEALRSDAADTDKDDVISALERGRTGPVDMLASLANTVVSTKTMWLTTFENTGSQVHMTGMATSADTVADFMRNLKDTGQFSNIELKDTAQDDNKERGYTAFQFELTAQLANAPQPRAVRSRRIRNRL